jgi:putative ubiquitin-RnfH superfamily antitoxin RatB of RatAB toxin-antitoxin module
MGRAEPGARLTIVVAYSPAPEQVDHVSLSLPAGATVEDALRASGLLERHPALDLGVQKIGVWGKLRSLGDVLRDGDRVEVYRPLKVDPKEARRQRYRSHRDKAGKAGKAA